MCIFRENKDERLKVVGDDVPFITIKSIQNLFSSFFVISAGDCLLFWTFFWILMLVNVLK